MSFIGNELHRIAVALSCIWRLLSDVWIRNKIILVIDFNSGVCGIIKKKKTFKITYNESHWLVQLANHIICRGKNHMTCFDAHQGMRFISFPFVVSVHI